jgi:hypothetical protein
MTTSRTIQSGLPSQASSHRRSGAVAVDTPFGLPGDSPPRRDLVIAGLLWLTAIVVGLA